MREAFMNGAIDGPPFTPAWWLRGAHRQTVWRRLFSRESIPDYRRERLETPDGDFLDLDWCAGDDPGRPLLLALHGLEGSSRSPYIAGLLAVARARGWDGVALNFRSCSGELNRRPRFYHSGETADLDWVVAQLCARWPGRRLALVGYSLGGNVALKWLGERGAGAPPEVRAAAAISVPFDLAVAAYQVDHGVGWFYGQMFLRTLRAKAIAKAQRFSGLLDPAAVAAIRSFAAFDDRVTAPLHGFADARDYWTRASCRPWLGAIQRPTLLINACDDPFLPAAHLPRAEIAGAPRLHAEFPRRGGHVGFVQGAWPGRARYWIDTRILTFLESMLTAAPGTGWGQI